MSSDTPKVSIIVPIYNCQEYLTRCLDSLVGQTLDGIEIILVNDGSKDGSLQICQDYAAKHSNIVVIDQPNGGAAKARVAGISHAQGEYITFVDSDDWVHPAMYETLYTEAQRTHSEIIQCGFIRTDNSKECIEVDSSKTQARTYSSRDAMMQLFGCHSRTEFNFLLWNKLFRKDTLQDIAGCAYHKANNDVPVIPRAFYAAGHIAVMDQPFVYYFSRNNKQNKSLSDVNNALLSTKVQSHISAFEDISSYFKDKDHHLYLASLRLTIAWALTALIRKNISKECKRYAKDVIKKSQIWGNPFIPWKKKIVALTIQVLAR